jgi:hypothetical protein
MLLSAGYTRCLSTVSFRISDAPLKTGSQKGLTVGTRSGKLGRKLITTLIVASPTTISWMRSTFHYSTVDQSLHSPPPPPPPLLSAAFPPIGPPNTSPSLSPFSRSSFLFFLSLSTSSSCSLLVPCFGYFSHSFSM